MHAFQTINPDEILNTLVSLITAFLMGGIVGFERQYRQRTAGLRTNVLICVGAAIFVDMAFRIAGPDGAVRVVAYVVSGVGFLGAGVIMREEGHVRGLNTAATLWGSAAIGACAGADLIVEAVLATLFVLAANTLLRPVVNSINLLPVDAQATEITHIIHIITPGDTASGRHPGAGRSPGTRKLPAGRTGNQPLRRRAGGDQSHTDGHVHRPARQRPRAGPAVRLPGYTTSLLGNQYVGVSRWTRLGVPAL